MANQFSNCPPLGAPPPFPTSISNPGLGSNYRLYHSSGNLGLIVLDDSGAHGAKKNYELRRTPGGLSFYLVGDGGYDPVPFEISILIHSFTVYEARTKSVELYNALQAPLYLVKENCATGFDLVTWDQTDIRFDTTTETFDTVLGPIGSGALTPPPTLNAFRELHAVGSALNEISAASLNPYLETHWQVPITLLPKFPFWTDVRTTTLAAYNSANKVLF